MTTRLRIGVLGALAIASLMAGPAAAAVKPGDILVADSGFAGLIKVDPVTGRQSVLSSNDQPVNASSQLFDRPTGVAISRTGRVFVTDFAAFGSGGVIEVDPDTGKQTKVSANDQPVNAASQLFVQPTGIAILPAGRLLIVDRTAFGNDGGVIAVTPATGEQAVFSSNDQPVNAASQLFGDLRGGIEIDRSGRVLVGDSSGVARGVIAIDPATGRQSVLSSNDQPVNANSQFYEIPVDVAESASGRLFVADQNAFGDGGLVGVDPVAGKQRQVSANDQPVNATSGFYSDPFDLAFAPSGRLLVADPGAFGGLCTEGCGGIISVDLASGKQRALSTNDQPLNASLQLYDSPLGIAVVPVRCQGRPATIMGTPGRDLIRGTQGADVIAARAGRDRILGLGGNDRICGGGGADVLRGGPGHDRLRGNAGRDRIFGGPGQDFLLGGPGRDLLRGGPGKDQLTQ